MRMRTLGHRIAALLSITLMLAGCGHLTSPRPSPRGEGEACRTLMGIDSMMWQQPDSAFALLLDFAESPEADCLDVFNGHYFQLLLAELLYKNDYLQTNRPDLQRAVACFDSLVAVGGADARGMSVWPFQRRDASNASAQTAAFLAARAHYINGVGYYERDSVVEACKEYIKAVETMEEHFEEKELMGRKASFIALAYTRLTEVFSRLYLHDQVIYFGQESLKYYERYTASPRHVAWILNEIGSNYDMMELLDSADYYYSRAKQLLDDTSTLMYRNIVAHQAYLEYKQDCRNAAVAISNLTHLLSEAESNRERMTRYSYIGEILYHEKQLDSAWRYLNIVFQETPDVGLKRQAAERLVEICKTQQKNTAILEYAEFLVPFANQEENKSEIKSQLTETYKTFIQKRLERQHYKQTIKYVKLTLEVISGMLVVILAISLLFHKNKIHKKHLENLIETERQAHKMQQSALAGRLKQSNAALKERNDATPTMASPSSSSAQQQQDFALSYEEEPVCQQILALCNDKKNPIKSTVPIAAYANIALNDTQKAQLKDAALRHYDSLFIKLKQEHPELKEKDYQFCYLSLLGLDNVQIAVLLQNSISTIWEREKRLKKILKSEDRIAVTLFGMMIN